MSNKKFSVGDLVSFSAGRAWIFNTAERRYSNPGIILLDRGSSGRRSSYKIMWKDGKITSEWDSYIKKFIHP